MVPRARWAESRTLPLHAAPLPRRLDVSPVAPRLWQEELTGGDRGGGRLRRPGLDLPQRGSVPGSVGSRRGRRWPGPRAHNVEHVEGAGAGGQSVSIGGSCGQGPRGGGEERGKGSWPCARGGPRHAPPARQPHHGGGRLSPRPQALPDRPRFRTSPFSPVRAFPRPPPPHRPRHKPLGPGRGRGCLELGHCPGRGLAWPRAGCFASGAAAEAAGGGHRALALGVPRVRWCGDLRPGRDRSFPFLGFFSFLMTVKCRSGWQV